MTLSRSRREFWIGIIAFILFLIAAANIVDDRCSMAVYDSDEPRGWEQVDFGPGHYKVMGEKK